MKNPKIDENENQSPREQAINKSEVDGQDINHQVKTSSPETMPKHRMKEQKKPSNLESLSLIDTD